MAESRDIHLIGVPMDDGKRRQGCLMGPDAFRVAGLAGALEALGHRVRDRGDLAPRAAPEVSAPEHVHAMGAVIGWTEALIAEGRAAAAEAMPIFMGGDHALAAGSIAGMAAHADALGRPFFVLWLDAHADFHTPQSSPSGNLHGTPLGWLTGREGFDGFPELAAPLEPGNLCLMGLRSVDPEEKAALADTPVLRHDMREIDEMGIAPLLRAFLARVEAAGGMLHVSLDVDFLDPDIAPGVGTTVPGGATYREAHLVMEMLHESGLVTSLDLVELNPFLDERGRTALLMVELVASLMGRTVFDRPTRAAA